MSGAGMASSGFMGQPSSMGMVGGGMGMQPMGGQSFMQPQRPMSGGMAPISGHNQPKPAGNLSSQDINDLLS